MRRIVFTVIACAVALTAQEAAAQEAAGPTQAQPTTIVYSDSGMSRMADLPMGVHRITDSNVIISGHQKGGGVGVLFGVVGMAIQSSANAEGGTAAGQPKSELCAALVLCVRESGCSSEFGDIGMAQHCYTGSGSLAAPTGPCKDEIEAAGETSGVALAARQTDTDYALGRANAVGTCAAASCESECLGD